MPLGRETLDLVTGIDDPLSGRVEVGAAVLELSSGGESLRIKPFHPRNRLGEIGGPLLRRRDRLLKTGLLRREIGSLGLKLAVDRGDHLVMFVLAFSQHLGSIAVALFRFSL